MSTDGDDSDEVHNRHEYTTQEIGQMLFDMQLPQAKYEKKMMTHKNEQEFFACQQTTVIKNINESLTRLANAVEHQQPPEPAAHTLSTRGWALPSSVTMKLIDFNPDIHPKLASGPPRFNGEHVVKWIHKIQKYYNHSFTSLQERLYLTSFLFDDAAEEWLTYWEDNAETKSWDVFLLAVKKRFDPDLYEDYVGRLGTLKQTSTVEAHQTEFESMLQKVTNVGDSTLTSLFIAGLKPPIKQELLTRRPATLQDAFALAHQLEACQIAATPTYSPRPNWSNRPSRNATPTTGVPRSDQPDQKVNREGQQPRDYPVVRISAAERAERTRKGLCWWCPEPYSRSHVCSTKFYALMGADDEDDLENDEIIETDPENDASTMVITGGSLECACSMP